MSGVNVPNSRSNPIKTIVPMALSAVGGAYGGPVGAAAGAKIGNSLVGGGRDPGAVSSNAIDRRITGQQQQQATPDAELVKAEAALQQLPPEDQAKYGPTIAAARQRAAAGQGGV